MNKMTNLIFDCDGTLIDSYPAITDAIVRLFRRHGVVCDSEEVRQMALLHYVDYCVRELAVRSGLDPEVLVRERPGVEEDISLITLMPGAWELLESGKFNCFVYTHRGESCGEILNRLGVHDLFTEIVDSTLGLKRKPDGEGVNYIIDRYSLDRARTFYVGDRALDIECGRNAGVKTVFLRSAGVDIDCSQADFAVSSLQEIMTLPL